MADWRKRLDRAVARFRESPLAGFAEKYQRDNASMYATLIAFNAILAMFPIMLSLLAIVGLFVRDEGTLQVLNEAIITVLPSDAEEDALRVVEATRAGSGLFGIIGFLGLLWGGSALFGAMADAFNRAHGVAGRGFIGQKLMAIGMIFVFAFLLLLSLTATSMATFLLSISQGALPFQIPSFGLLETVIAWLTSFVLGFVLFLSIYWVVPNRSFSFGQVWPGALSSAILFFLMIQVWPAYVANIGRFSRFGALFGLFFLIMTWFYFLAHVVMVGAELNAYLLSRRRDRS